MIVRPSSIAPVIVGITFKSSAGLWKRRAGIFIEQHLKENDKGLRETFELFNRQGETLMLIQRLGSGAPGWRWPVSIFQSVTPSE